MSVREFSNQTDGNESGVSQFAVTAATVKNSSRPGDKRAMPIHLHGPVKKLNDGITYELLDNNQVFHYQSSQESSLSYFDKSPTDEPNSVPQG